MREVSVFGGIQQSPNDKSSCLLIRELRIQREETVQTTRKGHSRFVTFRIPRGKFGCQFSLPEPDTLMTLICINEFIVDTRWYLTCNSNRLPSCVLLISVHKHQLSFQLLSWWL